jgi:hypothetical protein
MFLLGSNGMLIQYEDLRKSLRWVGMSFKHVFLEMSDVEKMLANGRSSFLNFILTVLVIRIFQGDVRVQGTFFKVLVLSNRQRGLVDLI